MICMYVCVYMNIRVTYIHSLLLTCTYDQICIRYLMGVGYPVDLVVCVALGVDMFDCVYPTRTARFGVALIENGGSVRIKSKEFANQTEPLEKECKCLTCLNYSRSYLHGLFKENEPLAAQAMTTHNVAYMMKLMRTMRRAIQDGESAYIEFIKDFLIKQYGEKQEGIESWVIDALKVAGVPELVLSETTLKVGGIKQETRKNGEGSGNEVVVEGQGESSVVTAATAIDNAAAIDNDKRVGEKRALTGDVNVFERYELVRDGPRECFGQSLNVLKECYYPK